MHLVKISLPLQSQSPDGEMVDALVSGASAERRVGSSPILGTKKEFSKQKAPFFRFFLKKVAKKRTTTQ